MVRDIPENSEDERFLDKGNHVHLTDTFASESKQPDSDTRFFEPEIVISEIVIKIFLLRN